MKHQLFKLLTLLSVATLPLAANEHAPARPLDREAKTALQSQVTELKQQQFSEDSAVAKGFTTLHTGQYHFVTGVGLLGETLELEDGSVWDVSYADGYKTLNWLTTDNIVIKPHHSLFSVYDYVIHNLSTGTSVKANLATTPYLFGVNSHWVINMLGDQITLEDGSIWDTASYDWIKKLSWVLNDHIIIGVNDDWLTSGVYPNILINANEDTFVDAACQN